MSNEITPPPELVRAWLNDFHAPHPAPGLAPGEATLHIATQAARWGADQELEACCEWFRVKGYHPEVYRDLRAARRPPPSLAEEALALIGRIQGNRKSWQLDELDVVRAALERLQELENQ